VNYVLLYNDFSCSTAEKIDGTLYDESVNINFAQSQGIS